MKNLKHTAAALAILGAVSSAQANDGTQKNQIQFMSDHQLTEIVGAKFDSSANALNLSIEIRLAGISAEKTGGPKFTRAHEDKIMKRTRLLKSHNRTYNANDVRAWIRSEVRACLRSSGCN